MYNNQDKGYPAIDLAISDNKTEYFGGNQYWYPKKTHQISGCGPTAAANLTAYLAIKFPDKLGTLYCNSSPLNKTDFVSHMVEIRKFVKPGFMGLTSVHQFCDNISDFAKSKNLVITPHIMTDEDASMETAVSFITKALSGGYPVAILVLTHQVKALRDYSWHWMTITDLYYDKYKEQHFITVSTYGEKHEIHLELLWNHRRKKDVIRLAYFTE